MARLKAPKQTVWVIMGNDFPVGVYSTEAKAKAFIAKQKDADGGRRIYWRSYQYVVDAEQ